MLLFSSGCASLATVQTNAAPEAPYLLHLPGIGGHMGIDDALLNGLKEGGISGTIALYDWTDIDRGLPALGNQTRHREQAQIVAKRLTDYARTHPGSPITITCHSAGCGIAVFALEQLPDDVRIEQLLMMQSALSPEYDLSKALRHVRKSVYSFYSPYDPVLDWGTRGFGTVDRVFTQAAGRVGYQRSASGDETQYLKLIQFPYDSAWLKLGNVGDHIGPMNRRFAREILAPLLLTGHLPDMTRKSLAPTNNAN
jgi:hypothetical protein